LESVLGGSRVGRLLGPPLAPPPLKNLSTDPTELDKEAPRPELTNRTSPRRRRSPSAPSRLLRSDSLTASHPASGTPRRQPAVAAPHPPSPHRPQTKELPAPNQQQHSPINPKHYQEKYYHLSIILPPTTSPLPRCVIITLFKNYTVRLSKIPIPSHNSIFTRCSPYP